jgi:hypothetical protein
LGVGVSISGGTMNFNCGDNINSYANSDIGDAAGTKYRIVCNLTSFTSGYLEMQLGYGTGVTHLDIGTETGIKSGYVIGGESNPIRHFITTRGATVLSIDDLSVKKVLFP